MIERIAIFITDNGYGHLRRGYTLAKTLVKSRYKVDLFCNLASFNHLYPKPNKSASLTAHNVRFSEDSYTTIADLTKRIATLEKILRASEYKYVISDSVVELVGLHEHVYFTSHFFWHQIEPNRFDNEVLDLLRERILTGDYKICASSLFSSQELQKDSRFVEVGLCHQYKKMKHKSTRPKTILVSKGGTDRAKKLFEDEFPNIRAFAESLECRLYGDDVRLKQTENFTFLSRFMSETYKMMGYALIRPGVGTVTECLLHDVLPITLHEPNGELSHIARQLEERNLGIPFKKLMGIAPEKRQGFLGEFDANFRSARESLRLNGQDDVKKTMLSER